MKKQLTILRKIQIRAGRNQLPFRYMTPFQLLKKLNQAVKERYDIEFKQIKYVINKTKAYVKFNNQSKPKESFGYDNTFNNVFSGYPDLAEEVFKDAIELKPPEGYDPKEFQNYKEEEKKEEENQRLKQISKAIGQIMTTHEYNNKTQKFTIRTIEAFKQQHDQDWKEADIDIQAKAIANQPVMDRIDEEKDSKKPIEIKHNNMTFRLFLRPFPSQQSTEPISDISRITQWSLVTQIKQKSSTQAYHYFDMNRLKNNCQKINGSVKPINSLCLKMTNNDTIDGFELISFLFNQIVMKVKVSLSQVLKIETNKRILDGKKIEQFYFHLAYPPKFYINMIKKDCASTDDFLKNWERVDNFPLLRNDLIQKNDFLRLYLFNNTIVKVVLKSDETQGYTIGKSLDKISEIIKNMRSVEVLTQPIIATGGVKLLQKKFDYKSFMEKLKLTKLEDMDNVWKLKYFILVMFRYNYITIQQITQLLTFIENNIKRIDYFIYILWKESVGIYGYSFRQKRLFEYIKTQFNKLVDIKAQNILKKISSNTDQIALVYRASLTPSGYLFNPPTPEMKGRLLKQFTKESQFFVRVSICQESEATLKNQKYITRQTFRGIMNKINIIDRQYIPLGWSPSQLRSFSLWYVHEINHPRGNLRQMTRDHILTFLGNFDQIANPAKKAARIGQSFSASWTFNSQQIKQTFLEDRRSSKRFLYTDGIGKISGDLLEKISLKLNIKDLSIIQMRYKGAKGVLVLDSTLPKNTITLRKSLIKYQCQHSAAKKYLDILDWNKYKPGFLNRQVIILLKTLGLKDQIFKSLQKEHIKNIQSMSFKDCSVFKQLSNDLNNDICNLQPANEIILQLLRAGFTLEEEPFFRGMLQTLKKNGYHQLKIKSSIRINNSARIIGIIDQYEILEENQVYCSIYDQFALKPIRQVIEGDVIVTRNPCLHPADIRKLVCIGQVEITKRFKEKGLQYLFQPFVNCVVFPMKGDIPITAQISGSDLDGDNFFISWEPRLIPKKHLKEEAIDDPISETSSLKMQIPQSVGYDKMLDFFIDYVNYEKLGQIDNSHLIHADQDLNNFANNPFCLQLAKIHGKAVDFPKTGYCPPVDKKLLCSTYPDFMEKQNQTEYISKSILGDLYRDVKERIQNLFNQDSQVKQAQFDKDLLKFLSQYEKSTIKQAFQVLQQYQRDLHNLISMVGLDSEYQIYSGNFSTVKDKIAAIGKNRLIGTILHLRNRYFETFFQDFSKDKQDYLSTQENVFKQSLFSSEVRKKAILYYLLSYIYKFPQITLPNDNFSKFREKAQDVFLQAGINFKNNLEENKRKSKHKYCGFVWFVVPKIIINIKIRNKKKQAKEENSEKAMEGQQNENSSTTTYVDEAI